MNEKNTQDHSFARGFIWGMTTILAVVAIASFALRHTKAGTYISAGKDAGPARIAVTESETQKKLKLLGSIIDAKYYEAVDEEQIADGLYKGIMNSLGDPYSEYYDPESYENVMASTNGSYYGIGTELSQKKETMQVNIRHVYAGSPAEKAGLKDGDILLEVEGVASDEEALSHLVDRIKGEEGSFVHIKVQRQRADGTEEILDFEVERGYVEVPTVECQMLDNAVGFLQIYQFTNLTAEQFGQAIEELEGQGMKALLVDLRDNPGGSLDGVCEVLDQVLPEGLIVYVEDKYGERVDYTSSGDTFLDLPIAVLINEASASASEIFAGAIKDYEYGTLIGTTTFGKGIVQQIIPLNDKSAVKITTARYFTPNGNYIHGVGIEPDIELEYEYQNPEDEVYDPMHDNQVQKGLEVLQGKQ